MSRWTELRDKLLGIGVEPKSIMISAEEQSRLMAEAAKKQYEAYMNAYQRPITAANTYGNVAGSPPKPTSITISLETFQNMQIESGKELLSALSVMMRMEGIDVADADKITIEIGDWVKVGVKNPVKSWTANDLTASGISLLQQAGQNSAQAIMNAYAKTSMEMLAQQTDAQIRDILKNGGSPLIIQEPPDGKSIGPKITVVDEKKFDKCHGV